jgi:hypothetical protein
LLGLGFCLFGLGLLVTIPLTALLLTCAQRLIQNKPIPALEVFDEVWR